MIIAADGLLRSSLRQVDLPGVAPRLGSRIGVGAIIDHADAKFFPGTITMAIARHGYAGQVQLDRERLLVAAAVDCQILSPSVDMASAVEGILLECGVPAAPRWHDVAWLGTPRLTRRPALVAAERLLVIGDAAGYVEPFTGEGMAIAFESAIQVAAIAADAAREGWHPRLAAAWQDWHLRNVRRRQWICLGLAWTLRRDWATGMMLSVVRSAPFLAAAIVSQMNHSSQAIRQLGPLHGSPKRRTGCRDSVCGERH